MNEFTTFLWFNEFLLLYIVMSLDKFSLEHFHWIPEDFHIELEFLIILHFLKSILHFIPKILLSRYESCFDSLWGSSEFFIFVLCCPIHFHLNQFCALNWINNFKVTVLCSIVKKRHVLFLLSKVYIVTLLPQSFYLWIMFKNLQYICDILTVLYVKMYCGVNIRVTLFWWDA